MTEQHDAKEHPLVGQVIGDRYRIDALLGEGGMGAVFRATHLPLDRPVAMKVLHPRLSDDEQIGKRFDREALAVSKLDHPNCVQVIDFGTTPKGMKYLVMQLLEGKELRELTGVAMPVEQVVYLGIQVLRALEHAHMRGLVHRDLKPENIFLVTDDYGDTIVKLVDFGIVKLLEAAGQEKLTRLGMAFGTPTYMSPEQAAGGKIDARTDLYAVGVLLFELLTGVPPFDADEPGILLRMHILADPPPLPDTVPPSVTAVVRKLLSKEPDDRYADAREARRALAAAYALPAKNTGAIGVAAIAQNATTDPAPAPAVAVPQALSPTTDQALAATRAEPAPSDAPALFVRSGGTVLAPPTGSGATPTPMPSAAASMSHGSGPIVPIPGAYDPLMMSSPGLPMMGPGSHASGVQPWSSAYAMPTPQRAAGRRTGTVVVVVLLLITWAAIVAVWLAGRDDGPPSPGAAAAPAAGVYRFADSEPVAGTPSAGAADPSALAPKDAKDAKGPKGPKKPKKPKDDD